MSVLAPAGSATAAAATKWAGGELAAVALSTGCVALYHQRALLQLVDGDPGMRITSLAWGGSGKLLVAARGNREVLRWTLAGVSAPSPSAAFGSAAYACDVNGGAPRWSSLMPTPCAGAVVVDANQEHAVVGCGRGIRLFDSRVLDNRPLPHADLLAEGDAAVSSIRFAPKAGVLVLTRQGAEAVEVWSAVREVIPTDPRSDGEEDTELKTRQAARLRHSIPHSSPVTSFAIHPGAALALATACADGVVRFWEEVHVEHGSQMCLCASSTSSPGAAGPGHIQWVLGPTDWSVRDEQPAAGQDYRPALGIELSGKHKPAGRWLVHIDSAGCMRVLHVHGLQSTPLSPVHVTCSYRSTQPRLASGKVVYAAGATAEQDPQYGYPLSVLVVTASGRTDGLVISDQRDERPFVAASLTSALPEPALRVASHPTLPLLVTAHASGLCLWHTAPSGASTSPAQEPCGQAVLIAEAKTADGMEASAVCWAPDPDPLCVFIHTRRGVVPVAPTCDTQTLAGMLGHIAVPMTPPTPGSEGELIAPPVLCPPVPGCWDLKVMQPLTAHRTDAPVPPYRKPKPKPKPAKEAEAPAAEGPTDGKAAMMAKYAHLLPKKQEEAPAAEPADGKAAMMAKYAHLIKQKQEADAGSDPADEAAARRAALRAKYAGALAARGVEMPPAEAPSVDSEAEAIPAALPDDSAPLTLRCMTDGDGLRLLVAVTADGRVSVWGWGPPASAVLRARSFPKLESLHPSGRAAPQQPRPEDVMRWTAADVKRHLQDAGLPDACARRLEREKVCGRTLIAISADELENSVGLRHRSVQTVLAAQSRLRPATLFRGASVPELAGAAGIGEPLPASSARHPQALLSLSFRGLGRAPVAAVVGGPLPGAAAAGWDGCSARGRFFVALACGSSLMSVLVHGDVSAMQPQPMPEADLKHPISSLLPLGAIGMLASCGEGIVRTELSAASPPQIHATAHAVGADIRDGRSAVCGQDDASVTAVALAGSAKPPVVLSPDLRSSPAVLSGPGLDVLGGPALCMCAGHTAEILAVHTNCIVQWTLPQECATPRAPYHADVVSHWLERGDAGKAAGVLRSLSESMYRASSFPPRWTLHRKYANSLEPGAMRLADPADGFGWAGGVTHLEAARDEEGCLTAAEAADIAESVGNGPPGLSPAATTRLLAIADACCQAASLDALDPPGQRYMLAVRLRRVQQKRTGASPMKWLDTVWAMHSSATDSIAKLVADQHAPKGLTWEDSIDLRTPLWVHSSTTYRNMMMDYARKAYLKRKDPSDAALLYVALGKVTAFAALIRQQNERLSDFFLRDFTADSAHRTAAGKNAFNLISKGQYLYAASFFLLAGRPADAVGIILQRVENWVLAFAVLRLWEETEVLKGGCPAGEGRLLLGPLGKQFLEDRLAEQSEGMDEEEGARLWQRHIQLWLLGRQPDALEVLWGLKGKAGVVCDLAAHAVKHAPQLHSQASVIFPARRRASLLLDAMASHLRNGLLGPALICHREYAEQRALVVVGQEGGKEERRRARREQREREARQRQLESGMLDFGAFGGAAEPAAAAAESSDEEEEEEDDGGECESQHVLAALRWQLGAAILDAHLRHSVQLLWTRFAFDCESPGGQLAETWQECVKQVRAALQLSAEELHVAAGALVSDVWRRAPSSAVTLTLILHACSDHPAGVQLTSVDSSSLAARMVSTLRTGPTGAGLSWQPFKDLAVLVKLAADPASSGVYLSRVRMAQLASSAAVCLGASAWSERNIPLILGMLTVQPPSESGGAVDWMRSVMAKAESVEVETARIWEGAVPDTYDSGGRSVAVLGTLVLHSLLFKLRTSRFGAAAGVESGPGAGVYSSAVAAARRALHSLHLELQAAASAGGTAVREVQPPGATVFACSAVAAAPMAARAVRTWCREESVTDLTGYAEQPPAPEVLHRWASSIESIARPNASLSAAADCVAPRPGEPQRESFEDGDRPRRRSIPAPACAANDVLAALQKAGWEKHAHRSSGWEQEAEEVLRVKKAVYGVAPLPGGSGCSVLACTARGMQDLRQVSSPASGPSAAPTERGRAHTIDPSSRSRRSASQGRVMKSDAAMDPRAGRVRPQSHVDAAWVPEDVASDGESDSRTGRRMRRRGSSGSMRMDPHRDASGRRGLVAALRSCPPPADHVGWDDLRAKCAKAHPTQPLCAVGGMDGVVHLYHCGLQQPTLLQTLKDKTPFGSAVTGVDFSPVGYSIAACSYTGRLAVWTLSRDVSTTTPTFSVQAHPGVCCEAVFVDDGGTAVATTGAGAKGDCLAIHDLLFARCGPDLPHAAMHIPLPPSRDSSPFESRCLASLHPHRDSLIVCGKRGEVCLFDLRHTQHPVAHRRINADGRSLRSAAVSPDGAHVAIGTSDGDIYVLSSLDLETEVHLKDQHPSRGVGLSFDSGAARVNGVTSLLWHPSEPFLYSTGADGRVCRRAVPTDYRQQG